MNANIDKYKELLETVPCNLCGADDYSLVYPARYENANPDEIIQNFRSSGDEILLDQLVRCNKCGLMYLNPRLKEEVVISGYSGGEDPVFVSQIEGREKTFAKSLKIIEKYKPERGHLLDIGTAGGSFLSVARDAGWEVAGCEPNRWLTEWSKEHYGLDITPGTLFDMQLEDNAFDVVTLWDVLEHTPDPTKVLREIARILKPGGILVTNVPDMDALVTRLMGRKYVFLLSIHLYYFTPDSLRKMFAKTGFKLLKYRTHWQQLAFGYIFFRAEAYIGGLAKLGGKIVKAMGMSNWQIPYTMGQTLFIAEKE
ncbi:MAG: class I SAM-dependent methyltransferase [Anaerolineales bacterium]|nr:class I SAM-dependent methyltransferase [Anaerolineales bacterium]